MDLLRDWMQSISSLPGRLQMECPTQMCGASGLPGSEALPTQLDGWPRAELWTSVYRSHVPESMQDLWRLCTWEETCWTSGKAPELAYLGAQGYWPWIKQTKIVLTTCWHQKASLSVFKEITVRGIRDTPWWWVGLRWAWSRERGDDICSGTQPTGRVSWLWRGLLVPAPALLYFLQYADLQQVKSLSEPQFP